MLPIPLYIAFSTFALATVDVALASSDPQVKPIRPHAAQRADEESLQSSKIIRSAQESAHEREIEIHSGGAASMAATRSRQEPNKISTEAAVVAAITSSNNENPTTLNSPARLIGAGATATTKSAIAATPAKFFTVKGSGLPDFNGVYYTTPLAATNEKCTQTYAKNGPDNTEYTVGYNGPLWYFTAVINGHPKRPYTGEDDGSCSPDTATWTAATQEDGPAPALARSETAEAAHEAHAQAEEAGTNAAAAASNAGAAGGAAAAGSSSTGSAATNSTAAAAAAAGDASDKAAAPDATAQHAAGAHPDAATTTTAAAVAPAAPAAGGGVHGGALPGESRWWLRLCLPLSLVLALQGV